MTSPAEAFKASQETALRALAMAPAPLVSDPWLYTEVPPKVQPPYVLTGEDQVLLDQNEGCSDEAEVFSKVDVWAKSAVLARQILAAVIAALNVQLTISGWDVDVWELQSESYSTDPDGSTHGIARFHYLLTEQVA